MQIQQLTKHKHLRKTNIIHPLVFLKHILYPKVQVASFMRGNLSMDQENVPLFLEERQADHPTLHNS